MIALLFQLGVFAAWFTGVCLVSDFVLIPVLTNLWYKITGKRRRELTPEEVQTKRKSMLDSNINLGIFWMLSIIVGHCLQPTGYKIVLGLVTFAAIYFYGEHRGNKSVKKTIEHNKRFFRNLRTVDPVTAQELANKMVFGDDQ